MWSVAFKGPDGRRCVQYCPDTKWTYTADVDAWIRATLGAVLGCAQYEWIMYNDEVPDTTDGASPSCGHCKGVLLWRKTETPSTAGEGHAFWLVHSVPRWPPSKVSTAEGALDIPAAECVYGQSFAWVPFAVTHLDTALAHVRVMQAHVYSTSSESATSRLRSESAGHALSPNEWHEMLDIVPGITHCAKHAVWGRDLYEDGLFPGLFLGRSCAVESWMRPHTPASLHVRNVDTVSWSMQLTTGLSEPMSYVSSADHSKWAVTDAQPPQTSRDAGRTFIGDINRMPSQFHRGGGGFVFEDAELWAGLALVSTGGDRGVQQSATPALMS